MALPGRQLLHCFYKFKASSLNNFVILLYKQRVILLGHKWAGDCARKLRPSFL